VSIAVSGSQGRGGLYAKYVWEKAPASAVKSPGDTSPPAGAIVVWGPPTGGNAGHIGISIGGGKFISATGGRVQILSIAGFGSYYGAMTPSFYV
jgi:cell wall-associated NlpC family hydrolase